MGRLFRVYLLFGICSLAFIGAKADTINCTTQLDLAFVVDSSGSICNDEGGPCDNWRSLLAFIHTLVNGMTVSQLDIRVSMIVFETSAYLKWNLTTYSDKTALLNAIDALHFIGGNTNTVAALDMLSTVFTPESGDRPRVRNTAILITDGKPRRGHDPIPMNEIHAAVQRVLDQAIRLLVVGVTNSIDMDTLKELSSPPHTINETVFVAENYEHIEKVLKQLQTQTCTIVTEQMPSPSTPASLCTEYLDICFVVDGSGSICNNDPTIETCNNWKDNVQFIRALADNFDIGMQATRVGLVTFSTTSAVQWNLTAYTDKPALLGAISNLAYHKGGTTDMTGGLDLMRTKVFGLSDDRPNSQNIAIFITDGYPTNPSTLEGAIVAVRNAGIKTFVVGVTDKIDLGTIRRLALQPPKENETYFLAKDYQFLEESVRAQLSTKACVTPTAAPAPPVNVNYIVPSTPPPNCDHAALDLVFLVDASGSICDNDPTFNYSRDSTCNNWNLAVKFIRSLVDGIFNSPSVTRIGLVLFNTEVRVAFNLTRYTDKNELLSAVSSLEYVKGGTTNMTGALRVARTKVFNTAGDKAGFSNTEVIITDGFATDPSTLQFEIDAARSSNIRILALGVTNRVDESTLQRLSAPPQQINVTYFMALNFVDIASFRKSLQASICQ